MYILLVTSIKKLHPMITLTIFYYRLLNTLMLNTPEIDSMPLMVHQRAISEAIRDDIWSSKIVQRQKSICLALKLYLSK